MTDVFTKEKWSEIMSLIRAKNTGVEKKAFSHLRKNHILKGEYVSGTAR